MRQDPVTGALMTDEQAAASDASVKEGLFARFEGRIQQIHERLGKNEEAAAAEKARLDALAQGQKQVEQGALDKVVAHFQEREKNLVLVTTELRADHDLLQKNFEALVARINGNSPGFYELLKAPAPPPVVEKVEIEQRDPPHGHPILTQAERRAQARKDAEESV